MIGQKECGKISTWSENVTTNPQQNPVVCPYASLFNWCIQSCTGYFSPSLTSSNVLLLICFPKVSHSVTWARTGNVFQIMSVCRFEVMVWTRNDSDTRVLAWCRAQKLYIYLIIPDHNIMQVFCIFNCLSNMKLLVCMSSRGIGRLLILPLM